MYSLYCVENKITGQKYIGITSLKPEERWKKHQYASKTEKKVNEKTGRIAQHYQCAKCKCEFTSKDVEVDHIKPVIDPKKGFKSWDEYINRLFCTEDNLQVLCKPCHKIKTNKEKEITKKHASK